MRLLPSAGGKPVSTHSRLKAAGLNQTPKMCKKFSFNTQPPKGGWHNPRDEQNGDAVSTHSRLKAAGRFFTASARSFVFQHTAA